MTENAQGRKIADYLISHRIIVTEVTYPKSGITEFSFARIQSPSSLKEPVEVAVIRYDTRRGGLLPAEVDEIRRRLELPGFVTEVARPFSRLLLAEGGDFILGEGFEPVHQALDQLGA